MSEEKQPQPTTSQHSQTSAAPNKPKTPFEWFSNSDTPPWQAQIVYGLAGVFFITGMIFCGLCVEDWKIWENNKAELTPLSRTELSRQEPTVIKQVEIFDFKPGKPQIGYSSGEHPTKLWLMVPLLAPQDTPSERFVIWVKKWPFEDHEVPSPTARGFLKPKDNHFHQFIMEYLPKEIPSEKVIVVDSSVLSESEAIWGVRIAFMLMSVAIVLFRIGLNFHLRFAKPRQEPDTVLS